MDTTALMPMILAAEIIFRLTMVLVLSVIIVWRQRLNLHRKRLFCLLDLDYWYIWWRQHLSIYAVIAVVVVVIIFVIVGRRR